ncbi:MAG: GNAT family N-acetyltransferase [Alphaproteobacteria bacterium]|nr:GNAT family N-acetyltransferase [Alphaproteobacteria bacterium]
MTALLDIVAVKGAAAGLLARLHAASFSRPGDETWSLQAFADVLKMPGSFCLLAQVPAPEGPEPIGFCACRVTGPVSELLSIGVVPDQRRRGTARRMIAQSIERCRRSGATEMFLEVAEDNPRAQQLYRSFGFQQVGRRRGYYIRLNDRKVDALTMRLDLSAA